MHLPTDVVPLAGEPDGGDPVVARLRALGTAPVPTSVAAEHLRALDGRPVRPARRVRRRRAAVVGVVAGGLLLGSTSLAAAGVLPTPAQTAMSSTLRRLGIEVPASRRASADTGAVRRTDAPGGAIAARAGDGGADRLRPATRPGRTGGGPRPAREAGPDRSATATTTPRPAGGSGAGSDPSGGAPRRPAAGSTAGPAPGARTPAASGTSTPSSTPPPSRPAPATSPTTAGSGTVSGPRPPAPADSPTAAGPSWPAATPAAPDDGARTFVTWADGDVAPTGPGAPSDRLGAP